MIKIVSYKQLIDVSNATILSLIKAMKNMGLNYDLIWNEMSFTFRDLLKNSDFLFQGSTVKEIADSFSAKIKEIGFCQKVEIKEANDNKVVIDIGDCIFSTACRSLRGDEFLTQPPCPMVAILYSNINENLGKEGSITDFKTIPEENSDIFTISLEG
ncbi:MAG: hypothetical protein ACTSPD_21405 [Promethearchaeota archaeon]